MHTVEYTLNDEIGRWRMRISITNTSVSDPWDQVKLTDQMTVLQADYLLEHVPGITIATDIICGFPTETEEDFLEVRRQDAVLDES